MPQEWFPQPILNSPLAVTLITLGLVALLVIGPAFQKLSWQRRGLLAGLRLGVTLLLLLGMLQPTCVDSTTTRPRASLLILFDQSRSMGLKHESGEKTRWQAQQETLSAVEPLLVALGEHLDVKLHAYDTELHPIKLEGGRIAFPSEPAGRLTDLGTPLHDAIREERGKRLAAVILLGDGVQTAFDPRIEMQAAAGELRSLDCPLYTIPYGPVGDTAQGRDIAVENLPDQYSVFVKNELPVRGTLRVRGWTNKDIPVELIVENSAGEQEILGPVKVQAREDNQQVDVAIGYTPQKPGQYKLTLRAAAAPEELVTKNNELSAFLTVHEGGLKVLYLEGEPRLEQKFLRNSIDASQDIDLDFQWLDHRRRDQWPIDISEVLKKMPYDVIILGDLDSAALYDEKKNQEGLKALAAAVDSGKGLLALGGYHSFGPGGYRATPLADVYPIVMDRLEKQDFGAKVSSSLHLEGPLPMLPTVPHYLTHLAPGEANVAAWKSLPPLAGANKFAGVKDRARVLAETPDGKELLVSGEYGQGRVLAFAGDSTWQWWMQGRQAEHKRFWRQAILWLAKRDEISQNDVWIKLAQRRYNPASSVSFTAGAKTAAGDVIDTAVLSAEVVFPNGQRKPLALSRLAGEWTGAIDKADTRPPGSYTIELSAENEGKKIGSAKATFMVYDHDVELTNSAAAPDVLARLSAVTKKSGGKTIPPEQLAALLREIQARPPELEKEILNKWRFGDYTVEVWLYFFAFVGLLTGEWALRKKWGLV